MRVDRAVVDDILEDDFLDLLGDFLDLCVVSHGVELLNRDKVEEQEERWCWGVFVCRSSATNSHSLTRRSKKRSLNIHHYSAHLL